MDGDLKDLFDGLADLGNYSNMDLFENE